MSERALLVLVLMTATLPAAAGTLQPSSAPLQATTLDAPRARYSDRTVRLAVEIDRTGARLLAYTVHPVPFVDRLDPEAPRSATAPGRIPFEVVLDDGSGTRFTRRTEFGPLCLDHDPGAPAHVEGDTILLHRDAFTVELPEVSGFNRIEFARYESERGLPARRALGRGALDRYRFVPAGGPLRYTDLLLAENVAGDESPSRSVRAPGLWPEDYGDTDLYRVYGNLAEGAQRINVSIVPDGYTYAEKALMEQHADAMVQHFRGKTPYKELDPFINYTLVYAYSTESGPDQCDCGIVRATAMGTRFPDTGAPCGDSANRCLYYGSACDSGSTANIVAAELRAPYHDEGIVMVNTPRYGGCGGARAVYSAGNSQATEVAVHELGHSLAGLADEYAGNASCGTGAGGINTSTDAADGAWSEWIADLGPPREGAQYYNQCVYRPQDNCEMRSLNQPFCPVCTQHWSLTVYGHPRVAPTAPVESISPPAISTAFEQIPLTFSVETRFSVGPNVVNRSDWIVQGPGEPFPTLIGTDVYQVTHTFPGPGSYSVQAVVIADTQFVKPSKVGANRDQVAWTIDVQPLPPPVEISAPGGTEPLRFTSPDMMLWQDGTPLGLLDYNLYRGELSQLPSPSAAICLQPALPSPQASDPQTPPPEAGWFYLVSGSNPLGEGPLGVDSLGGSRQATTPCD